MPKLMYLNVCALRGVDVSVGCLKSEISTPRYGGSFSDREVVSADDVES
jgi:hypothetical protein